MPIQSPSCRFRFLNVLSICGVVLAGCGPHLPPTTVPPAPSPELDGFRQAIVQYVQQTQPYRKQAAQQGAPEPAAAVRARQQALAEALRTKVRPGATQGQIFDAKASGYIKDRIAALYSSPRHDLLMDSLLEQLEGEPTPDGHIAIGEVIAVPAAPPLLNEVLPELPAQLQYDFSGKSLILRDVDAAVVVDYVPDALPETPTPSPAPPATAPSPTGASFLALPEQRGGTTFALIGDSGSGDEAQHAVAAAMLQYFTAARHFSFVLMLGDNLYHDDYQAEFLEPYKPLLDRGVKFYAALGNHDSDLEVHFQPFNMQDRDYYSFDQGNARFAVLNSNNPGDPAQIAWLNGVFTDAGTKWRIAFFHHPLYSSGPHSSESAGVIRPALEPALLRNKVIVVFGGHEHLYERVAPQHGIRYFVSGGGGRYLYDAKKNPFDEVALSAHHFMVAEIAGDAMYFEALEPDGTLIDCGIEWRTNAAREKGPNQAGEEWLTTCEAQRSPAGRRPTT